MIKIVELIVSSFIATLVMLPILSYMIFFITAKQLTKNHRRSVHIAMDFSTVFFIFSVHYLIIVIWNKHLFWLLMLFVLLVACTVALIHYKVKQEIVFKKVLKGCWRLNFASFFCIYVLLSVVGVLIRIFTVVMI